MNIKTGLLVLTMFVGCWASSSIESRILGGTEAEDSSHPHMVALTTGTLIRSYLCGGSLISSRSILTAAHCINHVYRGGSLDSSLRATVGTNRWYSGGTTYTIARNISHPNYMRTKIKNDIGILITSSTVALTDLVRAISLSYEYVPQGVNATVTGWGRTANESLSATLMEVDSTTIDGHDCVRRVAQAAIDNNITAPVVEPHIELCTMRAAEYGTCNGDSGSPLVRTDSNEQIGIVSWGIPCARGAPDVFVRVSTFKNWIVQNII